MNLRWLTHIANCAVTTAACCSAALLVSYFRNTKVPAGLEDALSLEGIFFAALVGTLTYMPIIAWRVPTMRGAAVGPIVTWFALSSIVAFASSVGGGVLRRWLTDDPTILSQPQSLWWEAMFDGWLIGFVACLCRFNVYVRFLRIKRIFDKIDAWIMGVFAMAGAAAALTWRPLGEYSSIPFVQLGQAILLAALTGAAGGLVAKVFARLTFQYETLFQVLIDIWSWAIAQYTRIAVLIGFVSFALSRYLTYILKPRIISNEEFASRSIDAEAFIRGVTSSGGSEGWGSELLLTDKGLSLALYVISGFAACYLFRSSD